MPVLLTILLLAQDSLQLGRQALARGRLEEAEAHLQAALAADPPRVFEIHYALGRLHLSKRDYRRALESFEECLTRAPRFAPALVGRARASLFLRDLDAGAASLEAAKALPQVPPEASALEADLALYRAPIEGGPIEDLLNARDYLRAGAHHLARGEREEAIRAFRVSQAIDDQNPVSFLFLEDLGEGPPPLFPELSFEFGAAREAFESGDLESASERARGILERRPLFVPARFLLIERAEREKRHLDALLDYEALLRELPPAAALHAGSARAAFAADAFELAECRAASALELAPGDPALFFLLAEAELGAGKAEEAITTCERAIAAGIATAPIYFTLGNALHAKMDIAASIEALRRAVELDPEAAENIASFALASLTTEDYEALRSLLESHVRSHPDSLNTLYGLGVMYLREGDLERARGYLERVRDLAPRDSQAYYNLALLHQRAGRADLAFEAMARFQELEAEEERLWQEGHRRHDLRIRAQSALAQGDYASAIELFSTLVETVSAETPSDYAELGEALLGAGRPAEAMDAFERARVQKASDLRALEGASRAALALGDEERAAAYREAAELLKGRCP